MRPENSAVRAMPDVAQDARPNVAGVLDWVGMGGIEVPITLVDVDGRSVQSAARVTAYVNLRTPEVRGIHMSRLYLHVDQSLSHEPLTPCSMRKLLRSFLDSHADLSDRAMVRVEFDHLVRRPALVSDNSGWKSYPVAITATMQGSDFSLELGTRITYSSTCPCSAALARQLIQECFGLDFDPAQPLHFDAVMAWLGSEQGIMATPHSQRSHAEVRVRLQPGFDFPILDLINAVEGALKTPVQTAVKRADEQAFARLNGQNLMFCEDAARRVQQALDADERIADFWVRASHLESLHPHDAVAVASKGVAGGYGAADHALAPLKPL